MSVLRGVLKERRAVKRLPTRSSMDMMDRLIEVEDDHGRRLDDEEIIDILVMYLNAGHESSGHISMWATVFLQENPEIFAKAKVVKFEHPRSCQFCNDYFNTVTLIIAALDQAEQEEIVRSIPSGQKGLSLRDFRKMEYLSQAQLLQA